MAGFVDTYADAESDSYFIAKKKKVSSPTTCIYFLAAEPDTHAIRDHGCHKDESSHAEYTIAIIFKLEP